MMKLTGFQLKLIAAFLMLIDHIYQFIPGTPIVFTYFGRLVAPVFIFLAVEGFHYTRNRYEYIGRLLGFWSYYAHWIKTPCHVVSVKSRYSQ